jgi:hypothetical protein
MGSKWNSGKLAGNVWGGFTWLRIRPVEVCCEHGDENSGSAATDVVTPEMPTCWLLEVVTWDDDPLRCHLPVAYCLVNYSPVIICDNMNCPCCHLSVLVGLFVTVIGSNAKNTSGTCGFSKIAVLWCYTVWSNKNLLTFQRFILPLSSGFIALMMKVERTFQISVSISSRLHGTSFRSTAIFLLVPWEPGNLLFCVLYRVHLLNRLVA